MTLSITFNGTNISKWLDGILLVTRNVGQNRVPQLDQVGRSDGKMFSYIRADEGTITVTAIVRTDVNKKRRLLADALTTSTPAKLVFADEPDIYYNAISTGQITLDEAYLHNTLTITFTVPDGIAHSVATKTADNTPYKDVPVNLLTGTTVVNTGIIKAGSQGISGSSRDSVSIVGGETYTYSISMITMGHMGHSSISWLDANKNVISAQAGTNNPWTANGGRFSNTFTAPSNAFYANLTPWYFSQVYTSDTNISWNQEKLEVGTTASPWSPNPADPEYYSDTITVPNPGTYPSEPVITATINGDDGVLTAINDQGSVLQFGSPDETDGFVKQKSERVYHLDFNQTPTGVTLNNGVTAFPYYEHGNDANVQSGPFGYANGIAYPSTQRTHSNYWNGPSMSGTIPKNSNGSNTANFQFVNRVNIGTNAAEVGRFEFNLTYQGKIVASLALFDDSASNDQWVFSGTIYDGRQAQMIFWDLLPRNYYRDGNYNAVITKMGDQLIFRLDRIDLGDGGIETRTISGFSSVPIDGWTAWFPGFSDQRGWSINWQDSYFEWINVDYWDDIPNRFKDGDIVKIDVANRRVLVNGAEDRTLQTIGNDWGSFKIQPGNNTIELLTSSWAKQCKAEVSWQEAWL
ncbi:phage tail protein [Lacticaseibacillus paracasei]|uniref:distal tail protein Dit n=1 Tax=Lacticaseibacillus paracasei TaxID=1597 RepID=UPI00235991FD|nr:distal tail protein Dit [Lacticaseibacillus paracasei]WCZ18950.1 phage tail protein [Lacticaseibacillus paracasei]